MINIEQIRQQAQDENTSSATLAKLAISRDWLTRQYVAGNPNTPVEILKKLVSEFPKEIMANPILDLLIMDNPRQLLRLQIKVAKNPNTPAKILDSLANSKHVSLLQAVAKNPNTPHKVLDYLKIDHNRIVRLCAVAAKRKKHKIGKNILSKILSILARLYRSLLLNIKRKKQF